MWDPRAGSCSATSRRRRLRVVAVGRGNAGDRASPGHRRDRAPRRGGLIVSAATSATRDRARGEVTVLLDPSAPAASGFNDLTTDEAGRIYVGSLCTSPFDPAQPKAGAGLAPRDRPRWVDAAVADDIKLTNGLGFSPDGRRLYHSDIRDNMVGVYDVRADGGVGARRLFARIDPAFPTASRSPRTARSGWRRPRRRGAACSTPPGASEAHRVPQSGVTSLCFGGDDLRDLYVVTGEEGVAPHAAAASSSSAPPSPACPSPHPGSGSPGSGLEMTRFATPGSDPGVAKCCISGPDCGDPATCGREHRDRRAAFARLEDQRTAWPILIASRSQSTMLVIIVGPSSSVT